MTNVESLNMIIGAKLKHHLMWEVDPGTSIRSEETVTGNFRPADKITSTCSCIHSLVRLHALWEITQDIVLYDQSVKA